MNPEQLRFVYRLRDTRTRERLLVGSGQQGKTVGTVRLPPGDPSERWFGEASADEYLVFRKEMNNGKTS